MCQRNAGASSTPKERKEFGLDKNGNRDWLGEAKRALAEGKNFRAYNLASRAAGEDAEKLRVMTLE